MLVIDHGTGQGVYTIDLNSGKMGGQLIDAGPVSKLTEIIVEGKPLPLPNNELLVCIYGAADGALYRFSASTGTLVADRVPLDDVYVNCVLSTAALVCPDDQQFIGSHFMGVSTTDGSIMWQRTLSNVSHLLVYETALYVQNMNGEGDSWLIVDSGTGQNLATVNAAFPFAVNRYGAIIGKELFDYGQGSDVIVPGFWVPASG